jgi:hypothetical protein
MAFEPIGWEAESGSATLPRADVLRVFMPFVSDAPVPKVAADLAWVRVSVRVGTPVFLALITIACLPSGLVAAISDIVSPTLVALAACCALAAMVVARGAGRQAAIHGTVAIASAAVFIAMLCGWIIAPSWLIVASSALAWFGGILVAVRELAGSAARLGSSPDVVGRLERRARAGVSVWLVGLAAVAMVAAVGVIAPWSVTKGPAFALVRLVALALSGYACIGLACWAVVFEVVAAGIVGGTRTSRPSNGAG